MTIMTLKNGTYHFSQDADRPANAIRCFPEITKMGNSKNMNEIRIHTVSDLGKIREFRPLEIYIQSQLVGMIGEDRFALEGLYIPCMEIDDYGRETFFMLFTEGQGISSSDVPMETCGTTQAFFELKDAIDYSQYLIAYMS